MGDFNASTGTERDGYETCVGPHGTGNVNQISIKFLDFARSHGLRVAGSWFQRPQVMGAWQDASVAPIWMAWWSKMAAV